MSDQGKSVEKEGEPVEEEGSPEDDLVWTTPTQPSLSNGDPLHDIRPDGSTSQFWGNGDESTPCSSSPSFLKMASLVRIAAEARFSKEEMVATSDMVDDPTAWGKALAFSTPDTMDRPTALARTLVKAMTAGQNSAGVWHGPLPRTRVSPPLTLGDCPVKVVASSGVRSGLRQRPEVGDEVQISKRDPDFLVSHEQAFLVSRELTSMGRSLGVWLKSGPGWTRVGLRTSVGLLLSRHGTLPQQLRADDGASQSLPRGRRSYAEALMQDGGEMAG